MAATAAIHSREGVLCLPSRGCGGVWRGPFFSSFFWAHQLLQRRVEYERFMSDDSRPRLASCSSARKLFDLQSRVSGEALSCSSLSEDSLGVLYGRFRVVFCDVFVLFPVRFEADWVVGCEYKRVGDWEAG